MAGAPGALKLGQKVPDFELTTYDPVKKDFGSFRLHDQIAKKPLDDSLLLSRRLS